MKISPRKLQREDTKIKRQFFYGLEEELRAECDAALPLGYTFFQSDNLIRSK